MPTLEEVSGVPAGHSIRWVGSVLRGRLQVREHEEYDANSAIVAIYESWSREPAPTVDEQDRGPEGFVKYPPHGWVLRRSDAGRRTSANAEKEISSAVFQSPSMRWAMEGQDPA